MYNPLNPVGRPTTTNPTTTPTPPTTQPSRSQPTTQTQGTYQADQYGQGGAATQGVPINWIANDFRRPVDYNALRMQNRLQTLGITNTAELLSRASTPAKRAFLVTTIAAMDGQLNSSQVRQYLNSWIGMADLCRTGMQIDTARLLQSSGIYDAPSLARYFAPMDKLALYGTMTQNAMRFGYRLPSSNEFFPQIDAARTLPMAVRW
jgi:hypothetical protein